MQSQARKPPPTKLNGALDETSSGGGEGCLVPFHSDSLHDLAGPVNQLSTLLALFQKRHPAMPGADDDVMLGLIQSAAGRMRSMIGGLQTYACVLDQEVPYKECDAASLVEAALALIGPAVRESGAVVTHDPLPQLSCDANQMAYAFASLIDNSLKFRGEDRPVVHISAVAEEQEWVFSVRDNGIGIDPSQGTRIFHLFKRLNGDRYAGAGAGLAICKSILLRHGGRIWLETHIGQGATFFFTFPRVGKGNIHDE